MGLRCGPSDGLGQFVGLETVFEGATQLLFGGTNRSERIRAAAAAVDIELKREDWYALWEAAQGRR